MSDGQSAVVPTLDTQHQVLPLTDDLQTVSLSMPSVIPCSSEAAGTAATDRHTASSQIFLMAAPHTLSSWQQVDDLPTETGVTFSPSPPGDSNRRCLVDAINRLQSYALREVLTARGLVGTVHHHLDPTTREQILAEVCRLYYDYAPRSGGSVVLPPGFVHIHDHNVLPAGTLIDSTGRVVDRKGHLVRLGDRTFAAEDIEPWSDGRVAVSVANPVQARARVEDSIEQAVARCGPVFMFDSRIAMPDGRDGCVVTLVVPSEWLRTPLWQPLKRGHLLICLINPLVAWHVGGHRG